MAERGEGVTKSVTDSLILIRTTGHLTDADGAIENIFFRRHDGRSKRTENIQERKREDVKYARGQRGRMGVRKLRAALANLRRLNLLT